ncbi:MAG: DNA polymerase III subunit alpha [Marinilabiliaceae bacterium]|nr:DNA polymerase III subunit alpha [Marinilabiliaceae bacterium]
MKQPTSFTHLHVHSQYSILDGQASIQHLVKKAVKDGMRAIALTDHGNMLGIKEFFDVCKKNKIKPIIGCETYVAQRTIHNKTDKIDGSGRHLILLAKNLIGYHNLMRLISIANIDGFYYRPRIDKQLLEKHHEGLIALSGCIGGEIPRKIRNNDLEGAEESVIWYKNLFGDDFYLELQRHIAEDPIMYEKVFKTQQKVNEKLIEFSKKYDVKIIASNDVHFTDKEMAEPHEILLCLSTGKDMNDESRLRYTRQEWFKTTEEMSELFADLPEAIENTNEITDKIEDFNINSDPIMPEFPIDLEFGTLEDYKSKFSEEDLKKEFGKRYETLGGIYDTILQIKFESDYLEHITIKGAKKIYGDPIPVEVKERIDFELETIKFMGFPSYFLIVQDFINEARKMGVLVGPGRGSAAGSVVAFCTGITLIDSIKYNLLFERFLNPDRISMPDVDIDFDDDGRELVLEYVAKKYGHEKVAHICTFGTMAAKSSIKDVGRVLRLPLSEADRVSKRIPGKPGIKLDYAYQEVIKLEEDTGNIDAAIAAIEKKRVEAENNLNSKSKDIADEAKKSLEKLFIQTIFAEEIKNARNIKDEILLKTLEFACILEGSIRHTGVHPCGVLIGREPLEKNIPLMIPKEKENVGLKMVTQYEGNLVESIGLLKMDFLGLRTLSEIKETLIAIKISKGIDVKIDQIPFDDKKTFDLFCKGDTTAIFQFESQGMRKYLRMLKPNRLEDLVAMNALYRPGPMDYIPDYIDRKHGRKSVEYDHPLMEPFLKDTYGVTVFQEQVMLLSRALGHFSRGESDTLRKAMGKKRIDEMLKIKDKFIEGCKNNEKFIEGCKMVKKEPDAIIEKIWNDWESFAEYAFNKSHSVGYSILAYQTGYLKANYPAEFMAGVLSCNFHNIDKITTFMEECRRMHLPVLGPDINESVSKFTVNKKGALRFGMAAIKGVGEGVVEEIVNERNNNGLFTDIYNFVERVNLQTVNKRAFEAFAASGTFDNLGSIHRAQYFATQPNEETTFIENLIKYGSKFQADKGAGQNSIFGEISNSIEIKKPIPPFSPEFSTIGKLEKEKELIGMYMSSHPLDDYKIELKYYCNTQMVEFENLPNMKGREFFAGGLVSNIRTGQTREKNKPFGILTLEDYSGSFEFALFGDDYTNFAKYLQLGIFLLIKGRVQQRRYDSRWEAKIVSISPLRDATKKSLKSMTFEIPLQEISEEFVLEFTDIINENKGNVSMNFIITDKENENHRLKMFSKNITANLSTDLVKYFDNHPEITLTFS